jgi:hypothetical protein
MALSGKFSPAIKYILFIMLGAAILIFPVSLPPGAGDWDFQAYWSSSYLLAQGQDFSDPVTLGEIQHTLTTREDPETLYAWYSPIGNVILLPFTAIPFTRAVYYWLIINIIILFYSALLIWDNADKRIWIPLLAVFSFSMSITSLVFGQVNTLEVLGLALFLSLSKSNKPYFAGASLVLTTVKPHLVILTLPILILDLIRKKDWKVLAGFFAGIAACFIILFAFYPPWMQSFWSVISSGMSTVRETPTINGLLVLINEYKIGKAAWLIALLIGIAGWWLRGQTWDRRTFIDLSLTAGLILSPIGWSYDQIMLVFPILSILSWAAKGELPRNVSRSMVVILILANLLAYYLRTFSPSDVWFFWFPFVVLGLYIFGMRKLQPV